MIRMVLALLVVAVLFSAVSQQPVFAQPEKATMPKEKDDKEKVVKVKATTPWHADVRENVVPVVGLVLMAIMLFQLIMLRSSIEKLNEKMGAAPT